LGQLRASNGKDVIIEEEFDDEDEREAAGSV
jgi:hypothetical protein